MKKQKIILIRNKEMHCNCHNGYSSYIAKLHLSIVLLIMLDPGICEIHHHQQFSLT